jgi:hypothetical protein
MRHRQRVILYSFYEWGRTKRTATVQALGERPLGSQHLHRPSRNIIRGRVSQHVAQSVLLRDVSSRLPNHNAEFRLVITRAILCAFRDIQGSGEGVCERGAGFREEDGGFGERHVGFFGVVFVVQAQASDVIAVFSVDGRKQLIQQFWLALILTEVWVATHLLDGQDVLGHFPREHGPIDEICFDLASLKAVEANISTRVD